MSSSGIRLKILLSGLMFGCACQAVARSCAPFEWVTDFDGAEKAAMVVTASVNGKTVDLQFDTGSDVSGFYSDNVMPVSQSINVPLSVGDIDLGEQPFYHFAQSPGRVAGRLGLQALMGQRVQIDYPSQRICLLDEQQTEALMPDMQVVPARVRSQKLFLYSELNGAYWPGLFFDSGASLYEVLVDKPTWQNLTGRQGSEEDNLYIQGWSNNQFITTVGARLQGDFSVAGISLKSAMVHFTKERPNHFSEYPINAKGLIGNAPFFDRVIVFDLTADDGWFGVLKP